MMRKALKSPHSKPFLKVPATQPKVAWKVHPVLGRLGWALLIIMIACLPLSYVAIPEYEIYDEQGSKPHHSTGVVTWMESATGGSSLIPTIRSSGNQLIAVRTDAREIEFTWSGSVRLGDRFDVAYRIGRSGRIYVDQATPIPRK